MDDVRLVCPRQPMALNFGTANAIVLGFTGTGPSLPIPKDAVYLAVQAWLVGGTGATVYIEGTNDPATNAGTASNWVNLASITLPRAASYTGGPTASDGVEITSAWRWIRAVVATNNGTVFVLAGG